MRIVGLARDDGKWQLAGTQGTGTEASDLGRYERIVIAIPSPQAAELLHLAAPGMAERAAAAPMAGCWTVMAAYAEPLDLGFAGAFVEGSRLAWIAVETTKRGRAFPAGSETIVLHAEGAWSDAHADDPPAHIVASLLEAFAAAMDRSLPAPVYAAAHRWPYARPIAPLGLDAIVEPALGLALCGDWVLGARVEEAYLSGLAAADRLLGS
jgi:predicted NAD/FAD-dependent oxidoreductase